MNRIEVNFVLCEDAPANGYNIKWRVQDSADAYQDAGNFYTSPAVFYDDTNPAGTCYEGFVMTDCNTSFGNPVNWVSCDSEGPVPPELRTLLFDVIASEDPAIVIDLNDVIDVPLTIDSVFVNGYTAAGCTGGVAAHMHSNNIIMPAGTTSYAGADFFGGGSWAGIGSHLFYNVVISWPGNENVTVNNGDTLEIGGYTVSISISGC